MRKHIHAASVVTTDGVKDNHCIEVENNRIFAINDSCKAPEFLSIDQTLIPGFVDIHSHGGGGFYFSDRETANIVQARASHRIHGTTTMLASLVTEPIGILAEQIRRLVPLVESGEFAGIHLEGPYLSPERKGAHQLSLLRSPTIDELAALIDAGEDSISMVTLAPELEGGIEAVSYLSSRGVKVALGHSQADAATTQRALDAGATLITHFSNGMPKPAEGAGTIAEVALNTPGLPLELILDGVHISNQILETIRGAASLRSILVTDAMSAAGCGDGQYSIGALDVEVRGGIARLTSNQSLAGSTLTMDRAFKNFIEAGASLVEAVDAASTLPAKVLGLGEVGSISIGKLANFLSLNSELEISPVNY